MNLDSLLTIAGLLTAAYAIMPRSLRLDVRLRLGMVDILILILTLIFVHYLLLLSFFDRLGLGSNIWNIYANWGLPPDRLAYFVILAAALIIGLRMSRARLTAERLPRFQHLTQELLWAEKYHELTVLLERHAANLIALARGQTRLLRVRQILSSPGAKSIERFLQRARTASTMNELFAKRPWYHRALGKVRALLLQCLPSYEKHIALAREYTVHLFTHQGLVTYIARSRPYMAIDIVRPEFWHRDEFLRLYFEALLDDRSSVLYHELRNNQALSSETGYETPPGNKLLHALVADSKTAEELAIYKPVGDYMLRCLDELSLRPEVDPYNAPMHDFKEHGQWRCPLAMGISFFDIMVTTALYKGTQWHMWLFYLPPITESICRNYRVKATRQEKYSEWPSRYSYLLYAIISALEGWILALRSLPPDQANIRLAAVDDSHENQNIPKSSILALGSCLKTIVLTRTVPVPFRHDLIHKVFRLYLDLMEEERTHDYAEVLKVAVFGSRPHHCADRMEYYDQLLDAASRYEPRYEVRDAFEELRNYIVQRRAALGED